MRRRKVIKRRDFKTAKGNRSSGKSYQKEKRRIPLKPQEHKNQRRVPFKAHQYQNIINTSHLYNALRKPWNHERRLQGFLKGNSRLDKQKPLAGSP